jgi:hypothetical protein
VIVLILLLTLGKHHSVLSGHAMPAPATNRNQGSSNPQTVADQFIALESARYNSGTPTPSATRTVYASVSCAADLAQMPATGPVSNRSLTPPRYEFSRQPTIIPLMGGRDLLRIARTDTASGDVGDGLFFLQKESGAWKVCGLFPSTQPSVADADGGEGTAQATSTTSPGSDTNGLSNGDQPVNARDFLDNFAHTVGSGLFGTAAQSICVDNAAADTSVENWARAHANIVVQSIDTSGDPAAASARIQVTPPGQQPATYGLILQQSNSTWCVESLQQQ